MTHIIFDSDKINWDDYIRQQQVGEGKIMSSREEIGDPTKYFEGSKYMRGYGIKNALTSVGRFLLPIASNLMEAAKNEAQQTVGRTVGDWVQGKPFVQSFKEHGKEGLKNIGTKVQQCGKGRLRQKKNIGRPTSLGDLNSEPVISKPIPKRRRKKDYLDM